MGVTLSFLLLSNIECVQFLPALSCIPQCLEMVVFIIILIVVFTIDLEFIILLMGRLVQHKLLHHYQKPDVI